MDIFIDTGQLYFIYESNPSNFDDLQLDMPFSPIRPPPPPPATGTGTTIDLNTRVAPVATASPAPVSRITTPTGALPSTDVFNLAALPMDVHLWLDQHTDPSTMMTQSTMQIEFNSLVPNKTLDPTGNTMRKSLSYLDPPGGGHHLFARNGALFSLKPQGSDGEKQFLANVPSCSGTSTTEIRNWYHVFTIHAAAHGFYVQSYFCFCLEVNTTTGFTCGNDTDLEKFDIPGKFRANMDYWTTKIWSALSNMHVFPANSPMKIAVESN